MVIILELEQVLCCLAYSTGVLHLFKHVTGQKYEHKIDVMSVS